MDMKEAMGSCPTRAKLSSARSVNFRPGALRGLLDALVEDLRKQDSGLNHSDVLRDGFTAFWPQIEAYLRARQQTKVDPALLAKLTVIAAKAMEHGVTAEELELLLNGLLEQKLMVFPGTAQPREV